MPHSIAWQQRHLCTYGMNLQYADHFINIDGELTPIMRHTAPHLPRVTKSWKDHRATQWHSPEPSPKAVMHELLAIDQCA